MSYTLFHRREKTPPCWVAGGSTKAKATASAVRSLWCHANLRSPEMTTTAPREPFLRSSVHLIPKLRKIIYVGVSARKPSVSTLVIVSSKPAQAVSYVLGAFMCDGHSLVDNAGSSLTYIPIIAAHPTE